MRPKHIIWLGLFSFIFPLVVWELSDSLWETTPNSFFVTLLDALGGFFTFIFFTILTFIFYRSEALNLWLKSDRDAYNKTIWKTYKKERYGGDLSVFDCIMMVLPSLIGFFVIFSLWFILQIFLYAL